MYALLNKERLFCATRAAGLRQPEAWFPTTTAEVAALDLPSPVVVKPRTHVGYRHWRKGIIVRAPGDLSAVYEGVVSEGSYDPEVVGYDPGVVHPFVQRYHAASRETVYNVTGYIGRDPSLAAFRATRKVLQMPRRLGNGLCFESAPVVPQLREGVLTMCRALGFHGIFEAEFVPVGPHYLLIDFNPRSYNAIGLDDARGFPLPWFAYLEAIGDETGLADAVLQAATRPLHEEPVDAWSHRVLFPTMLAAQFASGGMSWNDLRRWRHWSASHRVVDAVRAPDDRRPGRLEPLLQAALAVRDPRSFAARFLRR
jgi:D-aspartate ligase